MNSGDLCYGEFFSVGGIIRGLTNASYHHVSMLSVLWALLLQSDGAVTPQIKITSPNFCSIRGRLLSSSIAYSHTLINGYTE
jgi:hypothetical protein